MKKISYLFALLITLTTISCSKDAPTPEVDQEELGGATLIFTAVSKSEVDGKDVYTKIEGEEVNEIEFSGSTLAPPVGAHIHLEVGMTYKLELKSFDFLGREAQQTFISRADNHQAFLLGAPAGSISFIYGEEQNVGVTAYITILKESDTFVLQYIMRHLNNNVKNKIKASDWNNANYRQFTGSNDLDLKLETHLVKEDHSH